MVNKKGVILIWALLVIFVTSILTSSFFLNTMDENNLTKRHIASIKAFWAAEAGIAAAVKNIPSSPLNDYDYAYATTTEILTGSTSYYTLTSTGTVALPSGGSVSRTLSAVARTTPVDPANFQHAIRTTVDLRITGHVDINGPIEEYAVLDFPDLFENTKAEVEAAATNSYTDPPNNTTPVSGITWVNLSEGGEFRINDNGWTGSGILVIAGDAMITGGTFNGILYVIGDLRISGNPIFNGTILVESNTELVEDTFISGNVTINYNETAIQDALTPLSFASAEIVSWREMEQ